MTPETLYTLTRAFEKLDQLLPDARNLSVSADSLTLSYGRSVGCRGEYDTEWEVITLTWDEFLDWQGDYIGIETICAERWAAARAVQQEAKRKAQVARDEKARVEREEEKRLAPQRKRERELAELARLKKLYESATSVEDILHGGQS